MDESAKSHQEIRRVKKRVEEEILALPNVHAVDIGEKIKDGKPTGELSIVVYVDEKKDVADKNTVPPDVDGVKTDVQQEEPDVLHPSLLRIEEDQLTLDATRYATLEGGMSMGPCRAIWMEPPDVPEEGWYVTVGTLGAFVQDRVTKDPMALTNFHVAAVDDTWSVGDEMAQPARNDGGNCPADRFGTLERGVLSSNVDGAVIAVDGSRSHVCEILEIGDVAGTKAAAVGMAVRKRGRTTELTHGEVISVDYTTSIPYGDGLGTVTLVDQIRIAVASPSTMFGTNGDSGSVVVDEDRNIVGLYFAGNSSGTRGVANPIAKVLSELDVEVCVKPKLFKEWVKDFKIEKLEKIEIKESLKWEKFEKEKREKEKLEKFEIERPPKQIGDVKEPSLEKDPRTEKGPQIEKGAQIEAPGQPPGVRPPDFGPSVSGPRAAVGPGLSDPWAHPMKNFFDKQFPEVFDPKAGIKDKEEWKEHKNEAKESKESKDHKDSKDAKDKEMTLDTPPGGGVLSTGGGTTPARGSGHGFHFIPQHLRPDLGKGALRNEQY